MDEQLIAMLRLTFESGYGHALQMAPEESMVENAWREFKKNVLDDIGLENIKLVRTFELYKEV